jgi:hypothetical protein
MLIIKSKYPRELEKYLHLVLKSKYERIGKLEIFKVDHKEQPKAIKLIMWAVKYDRRLVNKIT